MLHVSSFITFIHSTSLRFSPFSFHYFTPFISLTFSTAHKSSSFTSFHYASHISFHCLVVSHPQFSVVLIKYTTTNFPTLTQPKQFHSIPPNSSIPFTLYTCLCSPLFWYSLFPSAFRSPQLCIQFHNFVL